MKLIQMNNKYSPIYEIFEYVFITKSFNKVFRITYAVDDYLIEFYCDELGFVDSIDAWDNSPAISESDKQLFKDFVNNNDFASLLYDLNEVIGWDYQFKIGCINRFSR